MRRDEFRTFAWPSGAASSRLLSDENKARKWAYATIDSDSKQKRWDLKQKRVAGVHEPKSSIKPARKGTAGIKHLETQAERQAQEERATQERERLGKTSGLRLNLQGTKKQQQHDVVGHECLRPYTVPLPRPGNDAEADWVRTEKKKRRDDYSKLVKRKNRAGRGSIGIRNRFLTCLAQPLRAVIRTYSHNFAQPAQRRRDSFVF